MLPFNLFIFFPFSFPRWPQKSKKVPSRMAEFRTGLTRMVILLLWSIFQLGQINASLFSIDPSSSGTSSSSSRSLSPDPNSSLGSAHSFSYHSSSPSSYSSSSSSSSRSHQQWPPRFHESPWLHKEFIFKTDPADRPPVRQETDTNDCDDANSHESGYSGYGYGAYYTCQATDECDQFVPSAHCNRKIKESRERLAKQDPVRCSDILSEKKLNQQQQQQEQPTIGKETYQTCHYLTESLIAEMCSYDQPGIEMCNHNNSIRTIRKELISRLTLRSCRRFSVKRSLNQHLYELVINSTDCAKILQELLMLDNVVEELACEYESILNRYDCAAKWSVKWSCQDCRLAYRDWLCSVIIPYHTEGILIKPCQTVCEQVEQKCPHLHPHGKGQYAGEPVFLCIDPNIPFNQQITPNIPFGSKGSCYNSCDLESCYNDEGESPVLDCYEPPPTIPPEIETTTVEMTTASTTESSTTEFILNPDIALNESIYETTTSSDYSKELIDPEDSSGMGLVSLLDEDRLYGPGPEPTPKLTNPSEHTGGTTSKSTTTTTTTTVTPYDLDQLNEFYDDSGPTSGPITDQPLNGDEDYYVIQSVSDQNINKQSQSIQFIELEPNYISNPIVNHQQSKQSAQSEKVAQSSGETNGNYVQGLQEIYKEALASTTIGPYRKKSNKKEKKILISLEMGNEQSAIIQDESWLRNQRLAGDVASSITTTTGSAASAAVTSTTSTYEYGIDITLPTGTEDTPLIVKNNDQMDQNKHLAVDDEEPLYTSLKTAADLENLGNRFRHYNSRSKEFILHEKKLSYSIGPSQRTTRTNANSPLIIDSSTKLSYEDSNENLEIESALLPSKLLGTSPLEGAQIMDTVSNSYHQRRTVPSCQLLSLLLLLATILTVEALRIII